MWFSFFERQKRERESRMENDADIWDSGWSCSYILPEELASIIDGATVSIHNSQHQNANRINEFAAEKRVNLVKPWLQTLPERQQLLSGCEGIKAFYLVSYLVEQLQTLLDVVSNNMRHHTYFDLLLYVLFRYMYVVCQMRLFPHCTLYLTNRRWIPKKGNSYNRRMLERCRAPMGLRLIINLLYNAFVQVLICLFVVAYRRWKPSVITYYVPHKTSLAV